MSMDKRDRWEELVQAVVIVGVTLGLVVGLPLCGCGGQEGEDGKDGADCVSDGLVCPEGTRAYGAEGIEEWCAYQDGSVIVYHGPYRKWKLVGFENRTQAILELDGQYCDGSRCGCWTWGCPGGGVRTDGCFTDIGEWCGKKTQYDCEEIEEPTVTDYPACEEAD